MRVDCFNVIIVDCRAEQAKAGLYEVSKMFGFRWRLHMDNNAIRQRSDELVSPYSGDLNLSIKDEYLQLRHYIAQSERHVSDPNPTTLCIKLSFKQLTSAFPNVGTAL